MWTCGRRRRAETRISDMSNTDRHVIRHTPPEEREGGTTIAQFDGLTLESLQLQAGEVHTEETDTETAWLLMEGRVRGRAGDSGFEFERRSLFDESASCVHVSAGTAVTIEALDD